MTIIADLPERVQDFRTVSLHSEQVQEFGTVSFHSLHFAEMSDYDQLFSRPVGELVEMIRLRDLHIDYIADQKDIVEAENSNLLSAIGILEDENAECLQRLDDFIERCRRYEEKEQEHWLHEKHQDAILENQDLNGNEKIIGLVMLDEIRQKQADPHEEAVLIMEQVAQKAGVSPSTVCRVNKLMNNMNGWEYKLGDKVQENGNYYTPVSIRMQNFLDEPGLLRKEKTAGGARVKGCKNPVCPSNGNDQAADRFVITYCRDCETVSLDSLPGTPGGADIKKAVAAIREGRYLISEQLNNFSNNSNLLIADETPSNKKQVAFELIAQPEAELTDQATIVAAIAPSIEMQNVLDQADLHLPEKQVAFELPAALPAEKVEKSAFEIWGNVEEKVIVCHARILLNKNGEIARKLEPVVSSRRCGSTHWRWSDAIGSRICDECWTPQPE